MKTIRIPSILAFSLLLICAAAEAFADDRGADTANSKTEEVRDEQPLLAGPKVEEEARTEAAVTRMGEQDSAEQPQVPPRLWLRMVLALELSEGQVEKIDDFIEKQQDATRAFHEKHGEALRALLGQMREARQAQDREKVRELMEAVRELRSKAPKPERIQSAIWGLLSTEQQDTLREQLEEWQTQQRELLRQQRQRRMQNAESNDAMDEQSSESMESDQPQRRRPGLQRGERSPQRGRDMQRRRNRSPNPEE